MLQGHWRTPRVSARQALDAHAYGYSDWVPADGVGETVGLAVDAAGPGSTSATGGAAAVIPKRAAISHHNQKVMCVSFAAPPC